MISKYKIYVDAAADIPADVRERYDIGVLPIPVTMGERTIQSGVEITNEEFYTLMDGYNGIPVTSQITPYTFEELYKAELAAGTRELILILINSKGSATYFNAVSTRARFYEENEGAAEKLRIHLFDGGSYSGGYGYAAILAAQKLEMGAPIDDVLKLVDGQLKKQRVYFGLYSLKYAGKSGRIPSAAVFVGEALGIKPIMQARKVLMVANGVGKADIIKKAFFGPVTPEVPASILQMHPDFTLVLDAEAASKLD